MYFIYGDFWNTIQIEGKPRYILREPRNENIVKTVDLNKIINKFKPTRVELKSNGLCVEQSYQNDS